MADIKPNGRGWHGNSQAHASAGQKGGAKTARTHDAEFYRRIGRKGGESAQKSGNAHRLSREERARGGKRSIRGSANDPQSNSDQE